jgi:hypothetical protein
MDPSRAALVERLATFPERLAATAPLAAAPPPGEWSASDVVRHLAAVEDEVWHARLDQLADPAARPEWRHTEPPARPLPDPSLTTALAAFAARRAETIIRLNSLDGAGWARTGNHATYGVLDVTGLVRLAVDHDDEHLAGLAPAPNLASSAPEPT